MALKGNIPWNKGLKNDKRLNKEVTWGDKISKAKIGHKVSTETKKKLSQHNTLNPSKGFQGHKHTEESKEKNRIAHIGNKNRYGTGYKCLLQKRIRSLQQYKQWRSDVFQRDNWLCKTCNMSSVNLIAHHIKSFALMLKENNIKTLEQAEKCKELWNRNNGITLCHDCHKLTKSYGQNI